MRCVRQRRIADEYMRSQPHYCEAIIGVKIRSEICSNVYLLYTAKPCP